MVHVAFEGIDGSGKSTQLRIQHERLSKELGPDNVGICNLNSMDHPYGRFLNKIYSSENILTPFLQMRAVRETLHAFAARINARVAKKSNKEIMLTDRSVISAFAYHVGKLPEYYMTLVEPALYPDIAIFIDVLPELAIERILKRGKPKPGENLDRLKDFYIGYQAVIGNNRPKVLSKTKIVKVNGALSLEKVSEEVHESLKRELVGRFI